MGRGIYIRDRWLRTVYNLLSQDAIRYRATGYVDEFGDLLDSNSLPITSNLSGYTSGSFKIVIHEIDIGMEQSLIGGIPNQKFPLVAYCKGDYDLRLGDKIDWPVNSNQRFIVTDIRPKQIDGVICFIWFIAKRDESL